MSPLGYLLICLSFSLPRLVAAMPAEGPTLATTQAPHPPEPRQTDRADFMGWISDGPTYSPKYCSSGRIFCTAAVSSSSTFVGCASKTASSCIAFQGCIGASTVVYDGNATRTCSAGHKCYVGTLYPAATSTGVPMYYAGCYSTPPPVYIRAAQVVPAYGAPYVPDTYSTPSTIAPDGPSSPSGLSTAAKAGIAVGASAGGSSIIAIIIIWWRRKGKKIYNNSKIVGNGNNVVQGMAAAVRRPQSGWSRLWSKLWSR